MKWFFLALLGLFTFGFGMLIVGDAPSQLSVVRTGAAVVFAIFCIALFIYWLSSYFLKGTTQDRGAQLAHAMLTLSFGLLFIASGCDVVNSDFCYLPLISDFPEVQLLAELAGYLQERGWCAELLGYSLLLLGSALSWPMATFFFRAPIKGTVRPPH